MKTFRSYSAKINIIDTRLIFHELVLLILLLVASLSVLAQSNKLETDKGIEASIAPYDPEVRLAILKASQYPQVLTRLQKSQTETTASFQKMISRFRKQKQEWFYTLTRYPDLMHRLANLPGKQTQREIYKLLPHQDPDLQEAAWKLYKNEKKNLAKLDNILVTANREFEKSIAHLSTPAQEAFRKLETKPDVLTLLTNNIDLTTRLGEQYKNNPAQVTNQLTVMHDNLEVQNEREAAAFKKQMDADPQAMKELRQASNAYSANPYYNNPYYYPYSYWFGYPYWYSYPMWYPGMFWYYPGFSFGIGGLYGFPSYGFSFWFYYGGYYTRYPHLYRQFGNYYRSNLVTTRATATVNRGFMGVASTHYGTDGARLNTRTSSLTNNRMGSQWRLNNGSYYNRFNTNTIRTQPLGGFGARSNIIGGGGGLHGGGHIGRH